MLYYISLSAVFIKTIRLKYTEYAESEFRSFEFATCKFNRVLPKWCKFTNHRIIAKSVVFILRMASSFTFYKLKT